MTLTGLIIVLFALPVCYWIVSYIYVAIWHRKWWLFGTVMHEDGRHTLWGALTYWAHFLACLPTALFVSACIAGGTLIAHYGLHEVPDKGVFMGLNLVGIGLVLVVAVSVGSVVKIGIQQTLHYALQRFERDNVSSWGGCWNQFIPSNIVISLGSVAAGIILGASFTHSEMGCVAPIWKQGVVLILALLWFLGLSLMFHTGKRSFTEPRWLAHSIREIATYPLTAVPAGLGAIAWVHHHIFQGNSLNITVPIWSVALFVIIVILIIQQLIILRGADIRGMSQKPPFAPNGLPIPYLLASHVFEHTLDVIFIALTAPGFYLLGLKVMSP